jgi:hypothetical protein
LVGLITSGYVEFKYAILASPFIQIETSEVGNTSCSQKFLLSLIYLICRQSQISRKVNSTINQPINQKTEAEESYVFKVISSTWAQQ